MYSPVIINYSVNTIGKYDVPYIICEINRFGLKQMGTNETELREFMNSLEYETYLVTSNSSNQLVKLPVGKYYQTSHVFNVLFTRENFISPVGSKEIRGNKFLPVI
ncbi:hypothetical protein [Dapis sp. BLCC M229]|uniref:hypothetical protein n=1 Tax=Dapis sp. BLCC M229 TaxID=3400188 RepID=UPI003CF113E2